MRQVTLSEIRDEIAGHFKRGELFPIIGSGFTCGSKTKYGHQVPSGRDMKNYMINKLADKDLGNLENEPFSKLAHYYEKLIPQDEIWTYFRDYFLGVKLPPLKSSFLNINWKYIYTLNLDDAIENNSKYSTKVRAGQTPRWSSLAKEFFVIKLHGDAEELVHTEDSKAVLGLTSYLTSFKSNKSLLDKLRADLQYSNTILIGCSLSDELDLLAISQELQSDSGVKKNRYYVTNKELSPRDTIDLEDYGVDTIISVSDYNLFYQEFIEIADSCRFIENDELDDFKGFNLGVANPSKNVDYLLHGKFLLEKKNHTVYFPHFYIERSLTAQLINEVDSHCLQIIHGNRISGKSYLLAGLLRKFPSRDTYYFDSRNHINSDLLEKLFSHPNSVFLFDTNVLTKDAMKLLLHYSDDYMYENNINAFCCVNNSDRDVLTLISYVQNYTLHNPNHIKTYALEPFLVSTKNGELDQLNKKLILGGMLPFERTISILDNLLAIQRNLRVKNQLKFEPQITINKNDSSKIALLILLVQKEHVSAAELVRTQLTRESNDLLSESSVTVEEDHRSVLQLSTEESASYQLVCNAKIWLMGELREWGKTPYMRAAIIEGFQQLVMSFLGTSQNFRLVEDLVKFDKLNDIFPRQNSLILAIYEGLKPLLIESYQYFHQCSKCQLWGISKADYSFDSLQKARTAALTAYTMAKDAYTKYPDSQPHHIALSHILFTLCIIHTKMCLMEDFSVPETTKETLAYLSEAISHRENYEAFQAVKFGRNKSQDSIFVIQTWLSTVLSNTALIPYSSRKQWDAIISFWTHLSSDRTYEE